MLKEAIDTMKKFAGVNTRDECETELAKVNAGLKKIGLDKLRANLATQEANLAVAESQSIVDSTKVEGIAKMREAIEKLRSEIAHVERTQQPIQERKSKIAQRLIEMDYGDKQREKAQCETRCDEIDKELQAAHEKILALTEEKQQKQSHIKNVIVPGLRKIKTRMSIGCDFFEGSVDQFAALIETDRCLLNTDAAAKLLKEWREPVRYMGNQHMQQPTPLQALPAIVWAVWRRSTGELRRYGSFLPGQSRTWHDTERIAREESHLCGDACPNEPVQERKALPNILAEPPKDKGFVYRQ